MTPLTPPTPLSTYSWAASSSSQRPSSSRYLNANRWETGRVTETLLVPLLRGRRGWTIGSQPLKSPTTDTLPATESLGRTKLTLTLSLPFTGICLITCRAPWSSMPDIVRPSRNDAPFRTHGQTRSSPTVDHVVSAGGGLEWRS